MQLFTSHWFVLSTDAQTPDCTLPALPKSNEPATSSHPRVEAGYQEVAACPPPWQLAVSFQFGESRLAGLAQPASDTPTTYLAGLHRQHGVLQSVLRWYSYSPFVATPNVSCYYLVSEPQPEFLPSEEEVHHSVPTTGALETATHLNSNAAPLGIAGTSFLSHRKL